MSSLFRKQALEHLTSPEQLDQRIALISRQSFLGLLAILLLITAGIVWAIFGTVATTVGGSGILTRDSTGVKVIAAQAAGTVTEILLRPGDEVRSGDVVLRLNQDGQLTETISHVEGEIVELRVTEGQYVAPGSTVAIVSSASNDFVVLAFLDAAQGKRVTAGMPVSVVPAVVNQEEYGSMPGTVIEVSHRPVSLAEIQALLQDEQLVELVTQGDPPVLVLVDVEEDAGTSNGFRWHAGSGPPFPITAGTLSSVAVTVEEQAPLTLILPNVAQLLGRE